jgi:uncharacterized coiled-coil protein SlyX
MEEKDINEFFEKGDRLSSELLKTIFSEGNQVPSQKEKKIAENEKKIAENKKKSEELKRKIAENEILLARIEQEMNKYKKLFPKKPNKEIVN